jgi:hypothetical protein
MARTQIAISITINIRSVTLKLRLAPVFRGIYLDLGVGNSTRRDHKLMISGLLKTTGKMPPLGMGRGLGSLAGAEGDGGDTNSPGISA